MLMHVLLSMPAPLARRVQELLADEPLRTDVARGALWSQLARGEFDLLLLHRTRLGASPQQFFARLQRDSDIEAIVLWDADEDAADRAQLLACGALAVLNTQLPDEALAQALRTVLGRRRDALQQRLRAQRSEVRASLADFVSKSPEMQSFVAMARRLADSDASLLILGETGVGKERLARAIHGEGPRRSAEFVAVNCGALPEPLLESELFGHDQGAFTGASRAHRGLFELAHGGTLFLDEVGDMSPALQAKLLRVLQERCFRPLGGERDIAVDVRVMAATNRDLQAALQRGTFRADLYFRLGVVALHLPPLRDRRMDIPDLVLNHLEALCERLGRRSFPVEDEAMVALCCHDWPGNVRELVNVLERAVLLGDGQALRRADLPGVIANPAARLEVAGPSAPTFAAARAQLLATFERDYITRVLSECGGRVGAAAARAGLSPRSMFTKMQKLGLDKARFRGAP